MSDDLREARLAELLCDRALLGLDEAESDELDALQTLLDVGDDPSLEAAAAAAHLALVQQDGLQTMPDGLADQLTDQFRAKMLDTPGGPAPCRVLALPILESPLAKSQEPANAPAKPRSVPSGRRAGEPRRSAAWPLAVAACVAFLLGSFAGLNSPRPQAKRLEETGVAANLKVPRPDLAAERRAMLAEAKDVVRIEWKATDDSAATGAGGDVVWSPSQQRGFMRFTGLRSNDASQTRYQLWIFDQKRDDRYPVDGGVFDIDAATGDIIIPIEAKLPVLDPSLFAVTVEDPNGVVVSNRERIVLTAAIDG